MRTILRAGEGAHPTPIQKSGAHFVSEQKLQRELDLPRGRRGNASTVDHASQRFDLLPVPRIPIRIRRVRACERWRGALLPQFLQAPEPAARAFRATG